MTDKQTKYQSLKDSIMNHVKNMTEATVYGVYFFDDNQWILESIYKHKHVAEYQSLRLKKQAYGKTQVIAIPMYI